MIDLRAYRQSTMDYMEQNGITDVLLLYNVQNFYGRFQCLSINQITKTAALSGSCFLYSYL